MDDETLITKFSHIQADIVELKDNGKEQSKENKAITDKVTNVEKGNIRMEITFESIKKTVEYIKYSVLGFIIFCVLTYFYAQMSK